MNGRAAALDRARALRETLLRHGVPEVSIELQVGRPTTGDDPWNACHPVAVMSHHIASHPTPANPVPGLALVKSGRSDLPGPLCNGTAGMDLVYRIISMGLANHSGVGGPCTVAGSLGAYLIPADSGRAYVWGTEYEGGFANEDWDRAYVNRRTGKHMSFREFMGRANAGLVEGIWTINGRGRRPARGRDLSGYHMEHKTWAPGRKPDRKDYTTESGRAEIRRYNFTGQGDEGMDAKDVWDYKIPVHDREPGAKIPAWDVLAQAHNRSKGARESAARALRQAKANRNALAAMAESLDDRLRRAVLDALGPEVDSGPEPSEPE